MSCYWSETIGKKKNQYKFGTSKNEIDMVNDFAIRVFNRIKFMPNDKFH